jgi:hypothetical protein
MIKYFIQTTNYQGLYRTCGVKSKIEQLCVLFEQSPAGTVVDLDEVHPMNLASVVKLYLRRLPEPLFTYELYTDWLEFRVEPADDIAAGSSSIIARIQYMVAQLPPQNYDTLRFLMLHLNRVTWLVSLLLLKLKD